MSSRSSIGCGCAVLFLLALPFVGHSLINDFKLHHFRASFARLPHPPGTTLVRRVSDVGLLAGNGNHCDFFVGELRTYTGSEDSIVRFYSPKSVWSPNSNAPEALDSIIFLEGEEIPGVERDYLPTDHQDISAWSLPRSRRGEKLYIVYRLDSGVFNSGCDIRCW